LEGMRMSKSRRLLELMMAVNRKRRFKVRELAEEFGVSTRTMLRDLQTLGELGVPLYSETGPHGGYQVLRERSLAPIAFTEGEAAAVFFAIHALRHYAELPFEAEWASAERKFYLNMPRDIRERIDGMKDRVDFLAPKRRAGTPWLGRLLDAAVRGQALRIEYETKDGAVETRHIRPALLYADDGFWYCTAYCCKREAYRVFRCDRIRRAEPDGSDLEPIDPEAARRAAGAGGARRAGSAAGEADRRGRAPVGEQALAGADGRGGRGRRRNGRCGGAAGRSAVLRGAVHRAGRRGRGGGAGGAPGGNPPAAGGAAGALPGLARSGMAAELRRL